MKNLLFEKTECATELNNITTGSNGIVLRLGRLLLEYCFKGKDGLKTQHISLSKQGFNELISSLFDVFNKNQFDG